MAIDPQTHIAFIGHVLHMRGDLTPQPTGDSHGNYLLWNGEIFGGLQVKCNIYCGMSVQVMNASNFC